MLNSRHRKNISELRWESWKRIPSRSSRRVQNQEMLRRINKKQHKKDIPFKLPNDISKVQSRKELSFLSDRKSIKKQNSKRRSVTRKDSGADISPSNGFSINDFIQKYSVTRISPNSFINNIKLETERPDVQRSKELENKSVILKAEEEIANSTLEELDQIKNQLFESKKSHKRVLKSFQYYGSNLPRETIKHFPAFAPILAPRKQADQNNNPIHY